MKLSIVTTLYQSSAYIVEFHQRMTAAARALTDDYEIIFVNDGSPDDSLAVARAVLAQDDHVSIIDLSRNFGHHRAQMTGMGYAAGEEIFLIDVDLEDQPEWLLSFERQKKETGCDVVYGVQDKRKGGFSERAIGRCFYGVFNLLSDVKITPNIVTTRLMSKRYVDALLLHKEREIFIAGLQALAGFEQQPQTVHKLSRGGKSSYSMRRKIALSVNSITAFSNAPLVAIFYIGVVILLIAGMATLSLVWRWLMYGQSVTGWASVIASIWLLGGMMISFIGIIGIYLSKIFSETKQRPYSIIRQMYGAKR